MSSRASTASPTTRLAALALGMFLAAVVGTVGTAEFLPRKALPRGLAAVLDRVWPSARMRFDAKAEQRHVRVLAEIEAIGEHPWAGIYHTPYLSTGYWLAMAPESGMTLRMMPTARLEGWRWLATGDIVALRGSRLELALVSTPDDLDSDWIGRRACELVVVPWGEIVCAVPSWQMERFCAGASDGFTLPWVPMRATRGVTTGTASRGDDETCHLELPWLQRPTELPDVPSEYSHLLVRGEISTTITSLVDERPSRTRRDPPRFDAVYRVEAGSELGVAVGMRLWIEGNLGRGCGRVEEVAESTCLFALTVVGPPGDLVGTIATTRHPRAGEL